MSVRQRKAFKAIAVFLAFSFAQVYVQTSLAGPGANTVPIPQQFVARLTTRGNSPITVNGASASGGSSILTGATIETPDQVGATIDIPGVGTLDIAPNTKLTIEFDQNGAKVKLASGCAILRTKKNKDGSVETPQGPAATNDKKNGGASDVCFTGGVPTVNQGAASAAGAGAGAGAAAPAGGGLSTGAKVAIAAGVGGAVAGIVIGTRGSNPSP